MALTFTSYYETLVRVFFTYSNISYNCSKRSGIEAFVQASFNGIGNCLHVKKIVLIFNIFLFAVDDVKTDNLELYFRKAFRYKYFGKKTLV